jgi:succinyl-diaminopimelate desuccinylase
MTTSDGWLEFAQALISIPGAPGAEGDVARRVMQEMRTLGYDDVRSDEVGNVIGTVRGTGEKPPIMLCSHMDVVDIGDADSWEYPPFEGTVQDGVLHGRGAMDIKGPLAIQTYAARAVAAPRPPGDVIVMHTVLEERGGWGMEHAMARVAAGAMPRPAVVVLGEATNEDICIGHRGRAELILELHGVAGHASAPERARNPLDAIPAVLPALRDFAEALDHDDVLGRSTLAPTMVETLPRSRNVIPDRVRIVLDWRVLPAMTGDAAVARVDECLARIALPSGLSVHVAPALERQRTWTGIEEERRLFTPGFLLQPDHRLVRAAADAVAAASGSTPARRPWTFATDGGHSCGVHGIPTLGYAPGEERYAHTNRERLALDQARRAASAYPRLLEALWSEL